MQSMEAPAVELEYGAKIVLAGPKRAGKSAIANVLAENDMDVELAMPYHATVGVRILEFARLLDERSSMEVQLWDTSGDIDAYVSAMPVYMRDAVGVILVLDPAMKKTDMDAWFTTFVEDYMLEDRQVLVLLHMGPPGTTLPSGATPRSLLPRRMAGLNAIISTLESDEARDDVQDAFEDLLRNVADVLDDMQAEEESRIIQSQQGGA
ncbi:uncharacterized protein AMSG_03070 [Thecamonas trahens ATCC 50062]|uniref:GTP-binding protein n=1 Tax=Thecamonas trahens ATCC 50062 TaxID=461836 RepID=A0A0L0D5Q8_THETB|nr:hypothetical protein AMSG_03070 [Thecamonas trahens ATCC 50062]KNC46633.1 hypothetical protein AMSG_03070 [Thecamonas trahens ATCC 50062]|eukprot:XP_013760406.1 hypothetical protein AMSG_03070 [Thecamonas trahens ATCC 50062]